MISPTTPARHRRPAAAVCRQAPQGKARASLRSRGSWPGTCPPAAAPLPLAPASRRGRRLLLEALATALATSLLTSLALAQPAVLRDSPATTLERLMAPLQPAADSGSPLIDCP